MYYTNIWDAARMNAACKTDIRGVLECEGKNVDFYLTKKVPINSTKLPLYGHVATNEAVYIRSMYLIC